MKNTFPFMGGLTKPQIYPFSLFLVELPSQIKRKTTPKQQQKTNPHLIIEQIMILSRFADVTFANKDYFFLQ